MDRLKINFENCFGIGKLDFEFDFENKKSNSFLIYAPNGTMKTSFAKTFDLISKNNPKEKPCDKIYNKPSTFEVLSDDLPIPPEKILVINAEDNSFDASNKISTFLASSELKSRYDSLYNELNNQKNEFIKKLKNISQSTDCESELIDCFSENQNFSFFEVLEKQVSFLDSTYNKYNFRYNDIYDKKGNVKKFLEKNNSILEKYVNDYKNLLSTSNFFKLSSSNSFGTFQANEILKSIEDNSFFEAGHKFILEDGTEINNSEILKNIVQTEIEKIINDEKLKKSFDQVDKAIGANTELRAFKKVIEKDNLILVELKDYENFRKKIWINYLSEIKIDTESLVNFYKERKKELEKIISEAKKEVAKWKEIIEKFNSRFYVPFRVSLSNQEDIILKEETANLEFEYFENNKDFVKQNKENLLNILSKGEQRAFFILQFLFEIESRKSNNEKNLIIFDDVADSFDYKNKYAIIEYIKDLHLGKDFRLIILTHNFDFYRTIASRLNLKDTVLMTTKSEDKEINFKNGQYRNDVFINFLKNLNKPKIFISLIPFVRNIVEYLESKNCDDFSLLTSCFHKKPNSENLTVQEIFHIFQQRLPKLKDKTIDFGNEKILEILTNTADEISNDANLDEILLENKITIAIATRIKAEEYMISNIPNLDINAITKNQTNELFQLYKNKNPSSPTLVILDKVNLMTPENIHINAFMYEPLIDMSIRHLIELYNDVKNLN